MLRSRLAFRVPVKLLVRQERLTVALGVLRCLCYNDEAMSVPTLQMLLQFDEELGFGRLRLVSMHTDIDRPDPERQSMPTGSAILPLC